MKDYKKILEGVIDIISTTEKSDIGFANICTYIGENCPELKESEDEKIKEALIQLVKCNERSGYFVLNNVSTGSMIAWLEKQGEQKVSYTTIVETGNGGINALVTKELPTNGCDDEQKPAWSEEDEEMLKMVIKSCEQCGNEYAYYWLKSLKDRCTWKPNEWQLKAIKWIMDGDNPENWTVTLANLYNDLKKL